MSHVKHSRREWQTLAEPVTGPGATPSTIIDMVYHYPGGGTLASFQQPIPKLRAMQHDYLTNREPPYSLGYNWCVDTVGDAWEVRGWDIKCAAVRGYNDKCYAVQFFVPGQEPANLAQLKTAAELHAEAEKRLGRKLGVYGHYQKGTTATVCPGAGIKPQLPTIDAWAHQPPTPPPTVPAFDPNNRQYSLWPLNPNKPNLGSGSNGDAVRYLQGVMHFEVWRFAHWFAALKVGTADQQNWLNYLDQVIFPLNGNGIYDDTMVHAVYAMQNAFAWTAFDNQQIGPLEMNGTVGPLTWAFIDMAADGRYGNL